MKDIMSRSDYILQSLSTLLPTDISRFIIRLMFEAEFNDSKEDHKKMCLYFKIQNTIGINLSELKPPDAYKFRFNGELWRHIDYDNLNMHLIVLYKSYIQFENNPPIIDDRNKSMKILDKINKSNRNNNQYIPVRLIDGSIVYYPNMTLFNVPQYYNSHYDNETTLIRSNKHEDLNKFKEFLKNGFEISDWDRWHYTNMYIHNYDQQYRNKRKTMRNKIYDRNHHKKRQFKFKGR